MPISEIKKMLKALFDHYSMRSGKISCESLKSREFHQMMGDAGLIFATDDLYLDSITGAMVKLS